ncbi:MAG: HAMP domain-containing histidine kinase [Clostridia bacterium]|nr:HAMP domain-containing histidine kinase [Clostridia bacterium]
MRAFTQNLAVKIVSFILLVFLIFSLYVSVVGICGLISYDVYVDNGVSLKDKIYESYVYSYNGISMVEDYLNDKLNGYDTYVMEGHLAPGNTNFRYKAIDSEGTIQASNLAETDELYKTEHTAINCFVSDGSSVNTHYATLSGYSNVRTYIADFENEGRLVVSTDLKEMGDNQILLKLVYRTGEQRKIDITFGALREPVTKDGLYLNLKLANIGIAFKDAIFVYAVAALLICIFLFVILMLGAGHKKGVDGIHICKFNKIPFDLYCFVNLVVVYFVLEIIYDYGYSDFSVLVLLGLGVILFASMAIGMCMTFAARVKTDGWYKNTVIYFCFKCIYKITKTFFKGFICAVSRLPLIAKTVLTVLGLTLVEVLFIAMGIEDYIILWFLEKIFIVPLILYFALCMRILKMSAKRIAAGDTEHKVDTQFMILDFKEHGENLNGIGDGLKVAVAESVRSERMKAELITNVSHDIKTPLTSIINYVELLKREGLNGENSEEYLEVLERQSGRLKRLTEDLVEASKASTGNIQITLEKTDIGVLLSQAVAEYEEKMKERELTLVTDVSEEELVAEADGRRMWRVFDNLLNNICKYAQPHTRVYISAMRAEEGISVIFRNISKEPLNIEPEELTERFVRGDRARNTEGSGLGLSIAKSLTELQGGSFDVQIDGDLFKVTVNI